MNNLFQFQSHERHTPVEELSAISKRDSIVKLAISGEHHAEFVDHPELRSELDPPVVQRVAPPAQVVDQGSKVVSLADFRERQRLERIAAATEDVKRVA